MALRGCLRTHQTCFFALCCALVFCGAELHVSAGTPGMRFTGCAPVFTSPPCHLSHAGDVCCGGAAAVDPVTRGRVGLRPVTAVIVSRPLIFPACLSYYRPPCGSLGVFDTQKFVCLSVCSAEVIRRPVCSAVN